MDSGIDERRAAPGDDSLAAGTALDLKELARQAAAPALAVGAVVLAIITQFAITRDADIDRIWLGFVAASALFGLSALVLYRQQAAVGAPAFEFVLTRRWEIALVLAVVALAAFFRFFRFMEFPPGLWYDEAVNGTDALTIIDQDHLTVWRESNFGHSTIFFYLLIASFKTFGYTVFAMRLVPALAGMAAVIAFYFLARWLLGPVPAIIATAFLAVSRWAVTFSRVSWEASLQPLLEIMAVYFLVRGLETRNNFYFFMAGGSLAAGIYTYLAFRFVPAVMASFLVYIAITQWELIRRNIIGLIVYAVSFVVVVFPVAQYAYQNQDQFLARTRDINIFKETDRVGNYDPLRDNIKASFKMLNVAGDRNGRHNLPGAPMVDEVSAALLVLGMAVAVWSIRNWRKGAMAGWLILALIPGVFTISIENPSAIRGVGAIPPLFLVVGLSVGLLYQTFARTMSGVVMFGVLAVGLVAWSAVINYHDFFVLQANNAQVYESFTPTFTTIGQLIAEDADDNRVLISREFNGHPAVRVLGRGKQFAAYTPSIDLIFPRGDKDVIVVVDPRQAGIIPTLERLYPNLTVEEHEDPFGRLEYFIITVPADDTHRLHEVPLAISRAGEFAPPRSTSSEPLRRTWTEADLADGPIGAEWRGYLWVPAFPGNTMFRVATPAGVSIAVDGQPLVLDQSAGLTAPIALGLGEHEVVVRAEIAQPGETVIDVAGDNGVFVSAADALYTTKLQDQGFQAIYRVGNEFSAPPQYATEVPFAVGAPALPSVQAVDYRGILNVEEEGIYGFALDGASSAQLYLDEVLVVDNGGGHAPRRIEGSVDLSEGEHLLSIQYTVGDRSDWAAYLRIPGEDWRVMDGSEVSVPPGPYTAPKVVTFQPDSVWGIGGRRVEGLDLPGSVAVLPDGSIVVGWANRIAFVNADGTTRATLEPPLNNVADIDVTPSGDIVVGDGGARALVVLNAAGEAVDRVEGVFSSLAGIDVAGETVYVASPSGGLLYAVPLDGSELTVLPLSGTGVRQPSDIVLGEDGRYYVADFELRRIVVSSDGATYDDFSGAAGTGEQVPKLAYYGDLLLVTDPLNARILAYDRAGKQRGVYVFPNAPKSVRAVGIAVSPDGLVYVADVENGTVHRLRINIPPETAAELQSVEQ